MRHGQRLVLRTGRHGGEREDKRGPKRQRGKGGSGAGRRLGDREGGGAFGHACLRARPLGVLPPNLCRNTLETSPAWVQDEIA